MIFGESKKEYGKSKDYQQYLIVIITKGAMVRVYKTPIVERTEPNDHNHQFKFYNYIENFLNKWDNSDTEEFDDLGSMVIPLKISLLSSLIKESRKH
jgi:hypothetical protein